ncbi:unnamed protein product [Hyaloperonospora brassicae]|uniref:RxLR effector candidate protein n=1 Tax=Hyaloperonospora brassicae TaxID=162125 RepID=A0AAV0UJS5_HYABA|nr:unnamed protein product [Hyaloperonospora brassicae]
MRKLFPLISAFVAFQWTAADPTSTPTNNRTEDDDLLDKSTLALHLTTDEYGTPRSFGTHDSAIFGDGHVRSNNERRSFWSSLTSTVVDVVSHLSKLGKVVYSGYKTGPMGAQMRNEALHDILKGRILRLKRLMDRDPSYTPDAAVQQLKIIGGTTQSVATLMYFRDVDGMKDFAHSLLRAMAVSKTDADKFVLIACLDARVSPEEVFDMLPISEDLLKHGVGESARWYEVNRNLEQWLQYVKRTNFRRGTGANTRSGEGHQVNVDNPYRPEPLIVDILMDKGNPKDVVAFFEYLRVENDEHLIVEKAHRLLLAKYQDRTEELMLRTWANADLSPYTVIKLMPWADFDQFAFRVAMNPIPQDDISDRLGQVLRYVNLYRESHEFDENAVVKLLQGDKTIEELRAYLMLFEGHQDEDGRSKELLQAVRGIHRPTIEEMDRTEAILSDIREGRPPWSVTEVNRW